jgi:hypothetical protein
MPYVRFPRSLRNVDVALSEELGLSRTSRFRSVVG